MGENSCGEKSRVVVVFFVSRSRPPELVMAGEEVVRVRLAGQEFPCEPETVEVMIPKSVLTGFMLSEIPEELTTGGYAMPMR
jgi:hypothetical protein